MTAATASKTKTKKTAAKAGKGRKDVRAAELTAEVEAAQRLMSPDLLAEVSACREILDKSDETQIRERADVGRRLNAAVEDKSGRYGTNPAPLILGALAYKRDTAKAVMRVAKAFKQSELNQLLQIRHPVTHEGLTWSHIAPLSRVENFDKAKALADDAVNRGLSSKELVKAVTAAMGGKKSAGGRRQKTPQDLDGFIDDILAKTALWVNAADKVWFGGEALTTAFNAAAKKGMAPATVSRLQDALARVDELGSKVRTAGAELQKLTLRSRTVRQAAG